MYLVADGTDVTIIDAGVPGYWADWLLPGHGEPWTGGVAAAIERVRTRGTSVAAR